MRTLGIRQWLLVGIAVFIVSAALLYHLANLFDQNMVQSWHRQQDQQQSANLDAALSDLADNPGNWRDPAWRASTGTELSSRDLQALVVDPSGTEIFRAGAIPSGGTPARQAVVVSGGRQLGTVSLFVAQRPDFVPLLIAGLSVILALLFVQWQMGKYVVRPLEAMSVAARRIAGGNLDFELPASRVREVADVREAFEAMGEGLRGSIERQAQLEEERRFFIGAIAHDLRTPLFSLRGYLEGLQQGLATSPEKAAHYVAVCRQKADQLDRLVSDLFAFTKVEYLTPTLRICPLELGALLRRAAEGAGDRARHKGITLKIDGTTEQCLVQGDEHLLERAVENLLDNALRHTPEGGTIEVSWRYTPTEALIAQKNSTRLGSTEERDRTARSTDQASSNTVTGEHGPDREATLSCEAGRVVFTVADTGPGIPQSDMPHLFDPLFRGEASRNRQTGGAGLGLAIARRALLASGGDLSARNRQEGGAEFTGWLPARSAGDEGRKTKDESS